MTIKDTILKVVCICSLMWIGCSNQHNNPDKQIITFCHFWSEPAQIKALYALIDQYEQQNPNIDIQTTELLWSEGKAKLFMLLSSGKAPDIIHIGLEWAPEFIYHDIFYPLSPATSIPSSLFSAIAKDSFIYALPWTLNTRAVFLSGDAVQLVHKDTMSLEDFTHYIMSSKSWGVNATEPHTLLKKVLPIIWTSGGRLFQSLPLSSSFDSASLSGFSLYVQLAQNGVLAHSRELDKSFVNGSLHMLISGQWLIPSLQNIPHSVLSRFPGKSGLSVLSGDCLAISAKSDKAKAAQDFIKYLTSDSIASKFCTALPDAGIPALLSTDLFKKNLSSDYASFAEQCKHAILLPSTSVFIEAEKILEDEIMEAVYGRKSPEEAFYQAKNLILQLEKLHGK